MQRVWYANSEFITDDGVADALMTYARVLAIVNGADVVRIPGVDREGRVRDFQLIVGPASQILAVGTDEDEVGMDAQRAIDELTRRGDLRLPPTEELIRRAKGLEDEPV